ncbi:MAG: hypothetical protein LBG74_04685 [Spirochaetaceae bacterium]|jgi:hypothetical protein|nr:hypothetical protein [Spirochaetaceae bacterium]
MNYNYRSVDEWKRAVITLDDDAFFALMNVALGNIKTPFSKQKLAEELQAFLLRDEVRRNIETLIDENDIRILSALALLGEPHRKELAAMLAGSANLIVINNQIQNLEERYLIFRLIGENEQITFSLNPLLADILNKYIVNYSYLFPSYTVPVSEPVFDIQNSSHQYGNVKGFDAGNGIFAGLFSDAVIAPALELFVLAQAPYRADGLWKKKSIEEIESVFGSFGIQNYASLLCRLELLRKTDNDLEANEKKITAFSRISPYERRVYCSAALYWEERCRQSMNDLPTGNHLRGVADFMYVFLNHLTNNRQEEARVYPEQTLLRLIKFLMRNLSERYIHFTLSIEEDVFIFALVKTGLLNCVSLPRICKEPLYMLNSALGQPPKTRTFMPADSGAKEKTAKISFNGTFSYLINPETDFSDIRRLLAFSSVTRVDTGSGAPLICAEINRTAVLRALEAGATVQGITGMLADFSGGMPDSSLAWSIEDWGKRAGEVTLYDTLCVTLSPERQFAAHMPPLKKLILAQPAPGVLILNTKNKNLVTGALAKCGIDSVALPKDDIPGAIPHFTQYGESMTLGGYMSVQHSFFGNTWDKDKKDGEAYKENLYMNLEGINLFDTQKDALKARINRRLIVSLSQFESVKVNNEKLEARGLDFAGKSSIAKQALEAHELLEIEMNGESGRIVVRPVSVGKRETDTVLVAAPVRNSGGDIQKNMEYPLGKVKYIRRIKNSTFS